MVGCRAGGPASAPSYRIVRLRSLLRPLGRIPSRAPAARTRLHIKLARTSRGLLVVDDPVVVRAARCKARCTRRAYLLGDLRSRDVSDVRHKIIRCIVGLRPWISQTNTEYGYPIVGAVEGDVSPVQCWHVSSMFGATMIVTRCPKPLRAPDARYCFQQSSGFVERYGRGRNRRAGQVPPIPIGRARDRPT